jgi:hypothetical protein
MQSLTVNDETIISEPKAQLIGRFSWFCVLLASLALLVGCGEPNASVIIDNAGGHSTMNVVIDGQESGTIPAGDFKIFWMPPGEHKFYLTSNGRTLFNGAKQLDTSRSWGFGREYVFNPMGNQRYAVCKVVYGSTVFSDNAENAMIKFAEQYKGQKADPMLVEYVKIKRYAEPMPATAWFELPSGVQFILREPPDSVYSKSGSESRRALTRVSAKDHAQLRRGHMIEQPSEKDLYALGSVTERVLDTMGNLPPSN